MKGQDEKESLANFMFPNPALSAKMCAWAAYAAPWSQLDCTAHTPGLPAWVGFDGALLS